MVCRLALALTKRDDSKLKVRNIFRFVKIFYISIFSGCPHQIRQQEVHEGGGAGRLAGRGRAEAGQEAARESVDRTAVQLQHVM